MPRRLGPADVDAFARLSESRGWGPSRRKWGVVLGHPDHVAAWGVDDPQATGRLLATSTLAGLGTPRLVVGAMLVALEHERQGLGSELLRCALEAAGDTPVTLWATPAGERLYRRHGFEVTGTVRVVRGPSGMGRPGGPGGAAVEQGPGAGFDLLVQLDREATGTDRRWLLEALGRLPGSLVAWHGPGRAAALAWWCGETWRLAPVVGTNDEAVAAVLDALLATLPADQPARVDLDGDDAALAAWAADRGLEVARVAPRMANGPVPVPGPGYRGLVTQGWG